MRMPRNFIKISLFALSVIFISLFSYKRYRENQLEIEAQARQEAGEKMHNAFMNAGKSWEEMKHPKEIKDPLELEEDDTSPEAMQKETDQIIAWHKLEQMKKVKSK